MKICATCDYHNQVDDRCWQSESPFWGMAVPRDRKCNYWEERNTSTGGDDVKKSRKSKKNSPSCPIACPYKTCAAGLGVAGSLYCFLGGDYRDPLCAKFEDEEEFLKKNKSSIMGEK